MARSNRRRRTPGLTALLVALVCAAVGVGLIAYGAAHPLRVSERSASGLIVNVHNCYRQTCGYNIVYTDAHGILRSANIPGHQDDEPGAGSTTTIYYQLAHPTVARFSNTDYANDSSDVFISFGVILILFALVSAIVGLVKLVRGLSRARRHTRRMAVGGAG